MQSKKWHLIGIGGIGMSGLARLLESRGEIVSGSDLNLHGHSADNVQADMNVVYSSDIKEDNPELVAAKKLRCPLYHRSDLLARLMDGQKTLAIAGTHGKTTTTSLLTTVLLEANYDPTFYIGGILAKEKINAQAGKGDYFVAEADESDATFLKYTPFGMIVTNIDNDHIAHYQTEEKLNQTFAQFLKKGISPQHCFWCGDDARLQALHPTGISYGFSEGCSLRALRFRQEGWRILYDVLFQGVCYPDVEVALTGHHNALNSLAVFGLALQIGVPEVAIRKAFQTFAGVGRRCEKKGEIDDILFLDDYAHHPTEICTTLKAIRAALPRRRLIVIYQPHRYSRIVHCMGQFGDIFDAADIVIVTELYSSGEKAIPGVSHEAIMKEIRGGCRHIPRKELSVSLPPILRAHDVVVTLGAGDITKASGELMAKIGAR